MLRPIKVIPCLNGFIVEVGCQTVVFNTPDQLGSEIARFYKDPNAVEKEFIAKAVNKTMEQIQQPCDPNPIRRMDRPIMHQRAEVASLSGPTPYPTDGGISAEAQQERPPGVSPR